MKHLKFYFNDITTYGSSLPHKFVCQQMADGPTKVQSHQQSDSYIDPLKYYLAEV